jgi:hypothetical protein
MRATDTPRPPADDAERGAPLLPTEYPLREALRIYALRLWALILVQFLVLGTMLLLGAVTWSVYSNGLLGVLAVVAGALLALLGDGERRRGLRRRGRVLWERLWRDAVPDRSVPGGFHGRRAG